MNYRFVFNITTKHIDTLNPQWQVFQSLHPGRNWAPAIMETELQRSWKLSSSDHGNWAPAIMETELHRSWKLSSSDHGNWAPAIMETELQRSWTVQCTVPTDNSSPSSFFFKLRSHRIPSVFTSVLDVLGRPTLSSSTSFQSLSACYTLITSLLHVCDNRWWISEGKHASSVKTKSHDEFLRAKECPVPLLWVLSGWLADWLLRPSVACYPLSQALRHT